MKMTLPAWHFRRMQPGEMNIDPIEAEFFSTEALGSLADALVREAIQNSLDARRSDRELTVRISFPSTDSFLRGDHRDAYGKGLVEHLRSSHSGLNMALLPKRDEPLSFLVIEDFGTRGLQGDPAQSEDLELEEPGAVRNDFFYFWRNVGRSRKHAGDLGRWGLGKTVFQAASRINSFFALTVRADDRRRLLLGQSVLKIHKLGGRRYYPYGYFGATQEDFALPIESPTALDAFSRDFLLDRGSEPGLSVVLPYPDSSLTPAAIRQSVVRHYFMPIIANDLRVEIVSGTEVEKLDADSLPRAFAATGRADDVSFGNLFELAKWGVALPRAAHVALTEPAESAVPRWDDGALEDSAVMQLRAEFAAGRRVAVTVPVWVKPRGEPTTRSWFDVYLERDDALERPDEHFIRDGITVTGVRAGLPKGVRALILIRDRALSSLVGDSENPAHTEWQERSPKFKDRYRHGATTLRYVKNVPRELVRLLTRPADGRDATLLRHVFSLEVPTEAELATRTVDREKPGAGGGKPGGVGDDVETVAKERQYVLQKLRGGFRVRGTSEGAEGGETAIVHVAYEVRRGNPFRQYQPLDFDLAKPPIEIAGDHVTVSATHGNVLILQPQRPDFTVTVRGFDEHRDLRVKVVPAERPGS